MNYRLFKKILLSALQQGSTTFLCTDKSKHVIVLTEQTGDKIT